MTVATTARILLFASLVTGISWSVPAFSASRFMPVHIVIDSTEPLAAWQFEFTRIDGSMQVVGLENGDGPAHDTAPYYDRGAVAAGAADRLVVAHYSLLDRTRLPSGTTRVATLHVMVDGEAEPEVHSAVDGCRNRRWEKH